MNPAVDERPGLAEGKGNQPISHHLRQLSSRILAWSEGFVSGRYWVLKVFVLSVAFSVLLSGGIDFRLIKDGPDWSDRDHRGYGYSPAYYQKIEHPLLDVGRIYPKDSHDGKLNFRLTVPVVLHFLGIRNHWALPLLTICATCSIILGSCLFAVRVTGDRVCGLFISLNVAATYIGSFGFITCYDIIAISQLVWAMMPGLNWLAKSMLVFTAGFTDERAMVASGLLLAQSLCSPRNPGNLRKRILDPGILAVAGALLLSGIARILLMKCVGLSFPTGGGGIGMFIGNIKFWHPGTWFSLEGGWLLVGLAMLALYHRRQFLGLGSFALVIAAVLTGSLIMGDLVRSTVYIFPALLVALSVVSQNEAVNMIRRYCFFAFAVSAIGGNYDVYLGKINWAMPLPVAAFYQLCHVTYAALRPLWPGVPAIMP